MWTKLDGNDYKRFHNVIFPTFNGTTQIDHILISRYGIFVIETKNINGWIFGDERAKQWTQSLYGKKYKFQNPLHQNYRHTKAVAQFLDIDHDNVYSIIFFIGDDVCLKTELPPNVMRSGLSHYIKGFERRIFSESEVTTFVSKIERLKEGSISNREHVENLKSRFSNSTKCPKCGKSLVKRTARKGPHAGREFLGCTGFPGCKYTRRT
jgi:hypothetical protein